MRDIWNVYRLCWCLVIIKNGSALVENPHEKALAFKKIFIYNDYVYV